MNAERRRLMESLFAQALELPEPERRAFLDLHCAGEPSLRAEIASLLGAHEEPEGLLDRNDPISLTGVLRLGAPSSTFEPDPPGTRFGAYTIKGLLGIGGMGVVYVAEQERPRRTVALKVIRPGYASPSILRRFENEAELLGRLHHPGIAQVFEAGSAVSSRGGGPQPFLAMELIEGPSLLAYCQRRSLGTAGRLELLAKVCDAVQHAHSKGVIHRDLKPGNILVETTSEPSTTTAGQAARALDAQPKVLDFGVARATSSDVALTTLQTHVGQIVGTMAYMSPEQVLADPNEIDTRTDVYSLGVILYQLLTGRLPLDVSSRSMPEAARIIRDEPPSRMSTIDKVFRGDIDTIVAKALEKEKARRYQTAAALGDDLRRFLAGEPIEAKRDSSLYVLRKQLRRYRGLVAAALAFVLLLLCSLTYMTIQASQNRSLAIKERTARDAAEQAQSRLAAELVSSNIERGKVLAAAGNLTAGEDLIWAEYLKNPNLEQARWALREIYSARPCLRTLPERLTAIMEVSVSPDGRWTALGLNDGRIDIWDGSLSHRITTLAAHSTYISAMAFSPDSSVLASGSKDHTAITWSTRDWTVRHRFTEHATDINDLDFTADGGRLVLGDLNGGVTLWNARDDLPLGRLQTSPIYSLAVSPTSSLLATGGRTGDLFLFDLDRLEPIGSLGRLENSVAGTAFSRDGRVLAVSTFNRRIHFFDPDTREEIGRIAEMPSIASSIQFAPDGATLYTGGDGVESWAVPSGARRGQIALSQMTAFVLSLPRDGLTVTCAAGSGSARIWETGPSAWRQLVGDPGAFAYDADLSPDGRQVAIAAADGSVRLCDRPTGSETDRLSDRGAGPAICITYSPDGAILLVGRQSGGIEIWHAGQAVPTQVLHEHSIAPTICWDASGTTAVSASGDRSIRVWNTSDWTVRHAQTSATLAIFNVAIAPDGLRYLTGTPSQLQLWDARPGAGGEIPVPNSSLGFRGASYSPDGSLLALGMDTSLVIFATDDMSERRRFTGRQSVITANAWRPDGGIIASGARSGDIQIWSAAGGNCLATFDGPGGGIKRCEFAADGNSLLLITDKGFTCLIDLAYCDRHIAGNEAYQRLRQGAQTTPLPGPPQHPAGAAPPSSPPPSPSPTTLTPPPPA